MTDPNTNLTKYSYTDSWATSPSSCGTSSGNTDAYLTQITDAKLFTQQFSYCYTDGQLKSSTDRNSQTTSYFYGENGDLFDRLTGINYPDCTSCGTSTHSVSNAYSDAVQTLQYDRPPCLRPRRCLHHRDDYGPTGRVTQAQIQKDPDCNSGAGSDNTDTAYDGMGRVWTGSNPYCSSAGSSGATTYTYDTLGRASDYTLSGQGTVTRSSTRMGAHSVPLGPLPHPLNVPR